jgi:hypothetical protein
MVCYLDGVSAAMLWVRALDGVMRRTILASAALVCLIPLSVSAAEEDALMQKAFRIITQHRLLSRAELACSSLVLDEVTKASATVTVREKHGGKCGGAPETAPRRFTMEIDLKTGAAQWDNNDEMEMKPVP